MTTYLEIVLIEFIATALFIYALYLDDKMSKKMAMEKVKKQKLIKEKEKRRNLELDWWKDFPNLPK